MSISNLVKTSLAALAGAAMLAAISAPASAFTLTGANPAQEVAASHVDKVWCRWRCGPGWGWRGGRWGFWGPGAVFGGLAAGAIIGSALAAPPYYGPGYYSYGPGPAPCWRRVWGAYGWRWVNACY